MSGVTTGPRGLARDVADTRAYFAKRAAHVVARASTDSIGQNTSCQVFAGNRS